MGRLANAGVLVLAPPASAQSTGEITACVDRDGGVSSRMLDCGKAEIDKWDARVNAAYRALFAAGEG